MTWILTIAGFVLSLFFRGTADRWWEGFGYGAVIFSLPHFILALVKHLKVTLADLIGVALLVLSVTHGGSFKIPVTPLPTEPAPRKPILPWRAGDVEAFAESEGFGPQDRQVVTDLPPSMRKENIASKGLGCCVFRSADHAARYASVAELYGFPEWMVSKNIEGGGYPSKVDKLIKQICADRGVPTTNYLQHEGGNEAFLDAAIKTGRMVCVTYAGRDPRYGMNTGIDHMVNLVYLDDSYACILDNNFVGKNAYLWMTRKEFLDRWRDRGGGWAFVLLAAPAPQPPVNSESPK